MVGMAAMCWAIWTLRNKLTFEHYVLQNPVEIVFTVCSFLLHWTGLQKEEDRIILKTQVSVGCGDRSGGRCWSVMKSACFGDVFLSCFVDSVLRVCCCWVL
jgi:hypothetical protein